MVLNYKVKEEEKEDVVLKISQGETNFTKLQLPDPSFFPVDIISFKKINTQTYIVFLNEISITRLDPVIDQFLLFSSVNEKSKKNYITLKIIEIDKEVNALTVEISPITFTIEDNIKNILSFDDIFLKGKLYKPWKSNKLYGTISAAGIEVNHPPISITTICGNIVVLPLGDSIMEEVNNRSNPSNFYHYNMVNSYIFKLGMNIQFEEIPNQVYIIRKIETNTQKHTLKLYLDRDVIKDDATKIYVSKVPNAILSFSSSDEEKEVGIVNMKLSPDESFNLIPYKIGALYYWDLFYKKNSCDIIKLIDGVLLVENSTTDVRDIVF